MDKHCQNKFQRYRRKGNCLNKATVKDVESKLNTHEAVCAERWKETIERIKRLELILISSGGAVILLMAGMLWKI